MEGEPRVGIPLFFTELCRNCAAELQAPVCLQRSHNSANMVKLIAAVAERGLL